MGSRAVYCLKENGKEAYFYAHYGANALSPLLRLWQAMELREQLPREQGRGISHIFGHLDYGGCYQKKRLSDADMVFEEVSSEQVSNYQEAYTKGSALEMWVTLDLDENLCLLEYNSNCLWYRTMGCYSIEIDKGLENVKRLLEYGEGHGITDFNRLLAIYHNSTGLAQALDDARGKKQLSEYLGSSQAEEQRHVYREILMQETLDQEQEEIEW